MGLKLCVDHLRCADHHYWHIFLDLFAFADEFNFPQLRDDIMTVAISLDWARRVQYRKARAGIKIREMCDMIPSSSTFYTYIAKSYALWVFFDNEEKYADHPAPFLLKVLQSCAPLHSKDGAALEEELRDLCVFHEHVGEPDETQCRQRQGQDGAFYNSFLAICMQGVYEYDRICEARIERKKASALKLEESTTL
jgi:hypothetical protein